MRIRFVSPLILLLYLIIILIATSGCKSSRTALNPVAAMNPYKRIFHGVYKDFVDAIIDDHGTNSNKMDESIITKRKALEADMQHRIQNMRETMAQRAAQKARVAQDRVRYQEKLLKQIHDKVDELKKQMKNATAESKKAQEKKQGVFKAVEQARSQWKTLKQALRMAQPNVKHTKNFIHDAEVEYFDRAQRLYTAKLHLSQILNKLDKNYQELDNIKEALFKTQPAKVNIGANYHRTAAHLPQSNRS